jgi:cytochrome c peroxidase
MNRSLFPIFLVLILVAAIAATISGPLLAQGLFSNPTLPATPVPAANPMTDAKVRLGMALYFDPRLSSDGTISCASCHDPNAGFADPRPFSLGVGGAKGGRNAPTVLNSAHVKFQFWDGRAKDLEEQALGPIQNPVEMQMTMPMALDKLKSIPGYVRMFDQVFGSPPTAEGIADAIAAFERTVISTNAPYDRYIQGDPTAMSPAAIRGMELFRGKAHCQACHSGPNFTDGRFHNLGVGYANGAFTDEGRAKVTKSPADMGSFKTPGLRSVALTAPYLHDGSEQTLESVIDFYNRGGVPNPNLDPLMLPLALTAREKAELVEFMKALTGEPLNIQSPALPE